MDVALFDEPFGMNDYAMTLARIPELSLMELASMRESIVTYIHRLDVPRVTVRSRSPMPRLAPAGDGPPPPTVAELAQRAKAADPLAEVFVDPTPDQRRTTAEIEHEKTRRDADRQRQDRAIRWTQAALRVAAHHGVTGANPHRTPPRPQGAALAQEMLHGVEGCDGVPW